MMEGAMSMSICVRDNNGNFKLAQTSWKCVRITTDEGEAAALREAINIARNKGYERSIPILLVSQLIKAAV